LRHIKDDKDGGGGMRPPPLSGSSIKKCPAVGTIWLPRGLKGVRTRVYMEEAFMHTYN
jgi:hypothetical protein